MRTRKIAAATVALCLMGLARSASAQLATNPDAFRPFNGFFADKFGDGSQSDLPSQHQVHNSYNSTQPTRAPQPKPDPAMAAPNVIVRAPASPSPPPTYSPPPQRPAANGNYSFQYDDATGTSGPVLNAPPAGNLPSATIAADSSSSSSPAGLPIHERLKYFRQSPFGDSAEGSPANASAPPAVAAGPASQPATAAQLPAPPTDPVASQPAETASLPRVVTAPSQGSLSAPPSSEPRRADAAADASVPQDSSILINHKSPMLSVETIGPRKIVIGKEAAYDVLLQNAGDVAAEEVTVTVALPDWADVTAASASNGEVRAAEQQHHDPCRWMLGRIEAHSREKLSLKIVPKQSKPFELAVRWDFKPAPSQAMIEVQEPRLTMRLEGPREVIFGKRETYKLRLANSGNGAADNVELKLMPINAGDSQPVMHRLGTINPGDERPIEIELTAQQAGNLTIRVEANGDGGAHAELAEHVLVHRATLAVEVEGPAVQYVGTPARFKFRLHNSGDAVAKNVTLAAKLPTGVKFLSGSEGAISETSIDGGKVRWTIEQLPPGDERSFELKCALGLSGVNRLEITSRGDDDLVAAAEAVTRVEAVADLRLEVKDPDGPVPVGTDAVYELHLRNRGTRAAEGVEVMAYFSNGVEPSSAEGQSNRLSPGQVTFDPIPAIPPAAEVVLTVRAKAGVAGNHVFRTEVQCKSAGTRLIREEVTHFYQDSLTMQQAATAPSMPTATPMPAAPSMPAATPMPTAPAMPSVGEPAGLDDSRTAARQTAPPLPLPQTSEQAMPARAIQR